MGGVLITFSVVTPSRTIDSIETYIARFFWSGLDGIKHHFVAWQILC